MLAADKPAAAGQSHDGNEPGASTVLKGLEFVPALAAEEYFLDLRPLPSGAEAHVDFIVFTARLKSCPFKT